MRFIHTLFRLRDILCISLFLIFHLNVYAQSERKCEVYKKRFQEIIDASKISPDSLTLVCSNADSVSLAKLEWITRIPQIIINLDYFNGFPLNVFCAAVCHEIGHFKLNHRGLSNPERELDADFFCGFLMRRLSYARVEEVYEVLNSALESKSDLYPGKETRKESISKGWESRNNESSIYEYAAFNPRIIWAISGKFLTVQINGRSINLKTWYNHGLVYDAVTGSTVQLLNYRNKQGAHGIGRLITNKTSITYRRNGKRSFSIYDKGIELEKIDCEQDPHFIENDDLIIICWNTILNKNVKYLMRDYKYVHEEFAMPAYIK